MDKASTTFQINHLNNYLLIGSQPKFKLNILRMYALQAAMYAAVNAVI